MSVDQTPDSVLLADEGESLRDCAAALQSMHLEGTIDDAVYYGKLLQLARDWVRLDYKQEARDLICQISGEFLTVTVPERMRAEPEFHAMVHEVARALVDDVAKVDESEIDLAMLRGPVGQA